MVGEAMSGAKEHPTVSVVIPSYNRSRKLPATLEGLDKQTFQDFEVVLVDDASSDDTADVLRDRIGPRFRYIRHQTNRGGNAARLTGIGEARGRFIAFLDSDDVWHPDKLARQVALLDEAGPEFGLCTTWFSMISPDGKIHHRVEPTIHGVRQPELLASNVLGGYSTVLVSREALDHAGGPDPTLPACQDWELYLRLNQVTGVCVVPEHLVDYSFDVDDPVRISTRRASVIAGHRHVYGLVRRRFSELDEAMRRRCLREFTTMFANLGSPVDVTRVIADHPMRLWNPELARHAGHMMVRALRKARTLTEATKE